MSYTSEDILSDSQNFIEIKGLNVRKGSVGAALANARIMESKTASTADKQAAAEALKKLAPALITIGLMDFMEWKNPEIKKLFDQFARPSA